MSYRRTRRAAGSLRCSMVLAALFVLSLSAWAQEYRFVYDGFGSAHAGAENLASLQRGIASFEQRIVPDRIIDSRRPIERSANVAYRAGKMALLDVPVSHLLMLVQHEVFGHGARSRELGFTDTTYSLSLFYPYGDGSGLTRYGTAPAGVMTQHEELLRTLAGNEASGLLADRLAWDWVSSGRIDYREAILYLLGSNNLEHYVLSTFVDDTDAGNDIADYLSTLNQLYSPGTGGLIPPGTVSAQLTVSDLAWHTLSVLLDPFQWMSLGACLYRYLLLGEPLTELPAFGGETVRYLPRVRAGLSPFGVEYQMDNYLEIGEWLTRPYIRVGVPTFAVSYGAGFDVQSPWFADLVRFQAGTHGWKQPEFNLGGAAVRTISEGLGFSARVRAALRLPGSPWSFAVGTRYKSAGYLEGEPMEAGWRFELGGGLMSE